MTQIPTWSGHTAPDQSASHQSARSSDPFGSGPAATPSGAGFTVPTGAYPAANPTGAYPTANPTGAYPTTSPTGAYPPANLTGAPAHGPAGGPATSGPAPGAGPAARTAPGAVIGGRYALRAAVGHGGMGTVWRAVDTLLRRDVAVKEVVSPPGMAPSDRDAMYERTLREARAAAALSHPSVVQVYDVVTENGRPWIVMELLDARSLADMVIEDGPLAPRAVAKIGIALLGALEVAHAAGVLHRDVKPANVLIAADGRCVLTDFGVARMPTDVQLTTPGMVLGSPHFISPERAMGSAFGPPSDLFSLGVTLYTAVEGRPPFDRGDPIETMHAVVEDPPAPMVRAGALTNLLYGLLEKDPGRRFDVGTARALLRELLAGPLASQAPPHLMTDPYAVVPAQRPAPPEPEPARPTGQIGGRAMLGPGESPTDRIVQGPGAAMPLNGGPEPGGRHGGRRRGRRHASVGPQQTALNHQRPMTDQTGAGPVTMSWAPGTDPRGYSGPGGAAWRGGAHAGPGFDAAGGGLRAGVTAAAGNALATARRAGTNLVTVVRGWSRNTQIAAAAGVVTVLALGVVVLVNGPDEPPPSNPAVAQGEAPEQPDFPVQRFADRGVTLNVPKDWERADATRYVDFTDPDNSNRRLRILVEDATAKPDRFMRIAENGLRKADSCADPYERVELRADGLELDGHTAAELEYTCGDGDSKRHGIWRAIVVDGQAHSFFLTTPEETFTDSKVIFNEMVRSFKLAND